MPPGESERMKVIQLHIDGKSYYLSADHDLGALRQAVLAASAGVPAFVTFCPADDDTEVAVLVTSHTSVRLVVSSRPEPEVEDDEDLMTDVDQYGFLDAS